MKKLVYIFICLLLVSCESIYKERDSKHQASMPSIISDNMTERAVLGEFEWHYFKSPDGQRCYEVVIMIMRSDGVREAGFMGMSRVPYYLCEETDEQIQPLQKNI